MADRYISFHVDMDSPRKLLDFWGLHQVQHLEIDRFYDKAMGRALSFFEERGILATFFCVGDDIETSSTAAARVQDAARAGHEMANHTYSHPLGLTRLSVDELSQQIRHCSTVIEKLTGRRPVGFRAPGYDVNGVIIDTLEEQSFKYDSSCFWTILNPLIKLYYRVLRKARAHEGFGESSFRCPASPYYPSRRDWRVRGTSRAIIELPVARTQSVHLPFYNNLHLSMGDRLRGLTISRMSRPYLVYLFHLIEFSDLKDGIPTELCVHPNVNLPVERKLAIMKETVERLKTRYESIRTDRFVERLRDRMKVDDDLSAQ